MHRERLRRGAYLALAYSCIGLAVAGAILPILPATPFAIVAAWAAPKGSPRLAAWLETHRRLGPVLRAWRDERAVPTRAKWLACAMLATSWGTLTVTSASPWVPLAVAPVGLAVGGFLVTRPAPASERVGGGRRVAPWTRARTRRSERTSS